MDVHQVGLHRPDGGISIDRDDVHGHVHRFEVDRVAGVHFERGGEPFADVAGRPDWQGVGAPPDDQVARGHVHPVERANLESPINRTRGPAGLAHGRSQQVISGRQVELDAELTLCRRAARRRRPWERHDIGAARHHAAVARVPDHEHDVGRLDAGVRRHGKVGLQAHQHPLRAGAVAPRHVGRHLEGQPLLGERSAERGVDCRPAVGRGQRLAKRIAGARRDLRAWSRDRDSHAAVVAAIGKGALRRFEPDDVVVRRGGDDLVERLLHAVAGVEHDVARRFQRERVEGIEAALHLGGRRGTDRFGSVEVDVAPVDVERIDDRVRFRRRGRHLLDIDPEPVGEEAF